MRRTITSRFEASEGSGTWFYDVTYWREEEDSTGAVVEVKDHVDTVTMEGLLKQRDELAYALGNTGQLITECEAVLNAAPEAVPHASDQTPISK